MKINIERIRSRFDGLITKYEILKVYEEFDKINNVIQLEYSLEESIVRYLKYKVDIIKCKEEIQSKKLKIKENENKLRLLKRNSFDRLRKSGKLNSFLWGLDNRVLDELQMNGCILGDEVSEIKLRRFKDKRDYNNRNYNSLNLDGNICVSSNKNIWS